MKPIFYILLTLTLGACTSDDEFSFDCPNKSNVSITTSDINFEKIDLPAFETSYVTHSEILGDKIYLVDDVSRAVLELDSTGFVLRKMLGAGRAKNEYNSSIEGFCCAEPNQFIFVGASNDVNCYRLSEEGLLHDTTKFFWQKSEGMSELYKKSATYTLLYPKLRLHRYNDRLYMPIAGEHPLFNPLVPDYYEKTRIIRSVSLTDKSENQIMGRLSPVVEKADGKSQFFMFDYDIDKNGDFYVTYELDSLIYVFDNQFKIKETFGNKGKNANLTNHLKLSIFNDYRNNYETERKTKSFYNTIRKIDNYLFRTYQNDLSFTYDGLQIYSQNTLIGDVAIPRGMKIIGKIGEYYYSQILTDEREEKLFLYRFKLGIDD